MGPYQPIITFFFLVIFKAQDAQQPSWLAQQASRLAVRSSSQARSMLASLVRAARLRLACLTASRPGRCSFHSRTPTCLASCLPTCKVLLQLKPSPGAPHTARSPLSRVIFSCIGFIHSCNCNTSRHASHSHLQTSIYSNMCQLQPACCTASLVFAHPLRLA